MAHAWAMWQDWEAHSGKWEPAFSQFPSCGAVHPVHALQHVSLLRALCDGQVGGGLWYN